MLCAVKMPIATPHAPKAVGPYSQAVRAGNMLFCSGQIPLNPADSSMVGTDVQTQIKQVLDNVKGLLGDAGLGFEDVVKTTMFLKDMNDFPKANELYGQYFKPPYPARSTVQVARLPKDALVEVEVVALFKG